MRPNPLSIALAGFLYCPRDDVFHAIAEKEENLEREAAGGKSIAIADAEVRCLDLSCDGLTVAVGCSDGSIRVFDVRDVASGKTVCPVCAYVRTGVWM